MRNNSRISLPFQLLKTFTEKELINFEKLLSSGYLSANENLTKLLKILKKLALHHESFTPAIQHDVYKPLYSSENTGEALNEPQRKRLSRVMNELLNAAEKFLMFEDLKATDEFDAMMLYPKLVDRNQLILYTKRIKAAEKKLSKETKQGIEYHEQCYYIQREKARLFYLNNDLEKEDNFDKLQYHFDTKYLLEKLNFHLVKVNTQKIFTRKKFDLSPFRALQGFFNLPKYIANPLISLSLLNIDLVEKEDDNTFKALLNKISIEANSVPPSFLKSFYSTLTNYCIWQEAKGRLEFTNHLFKIYNSMHIHNLFIMDDAINIFLLKNMIANACRIKAFDWAKDKLSYYKDYVPKDIRNDVFNYNSGIIAFNAYNYSDALNLLVKVRKIDHTHDLGLRVVQLQCYYETDINYEQETQQLINSFEAHLRVNNKMLLKRKTAYLNFITIFKKLYKFKDIPGNRSRLNIIIKTLPKIKDNLLQYDLIREKKWLLNKIEELED